MNSAVEVDTGRNQLYVLDQLRETLQSELPAADLGLDAHEHDVIRALGSVLDGTDALGVIDADGMGLTSEDQTLLEIVLALHDVGKRTDSDGMHADVGYRLLNRHHGALRSAIRQHCKAHGILPVPDTDDDVRMILWLVRHHEVPHELWEGEHRAVHLDQIATRLCKGCRECHGAKRCAACKSKTVKAFRLLFVVALCDSLSTVSQDVVKQRVEFWQKVIELEDRSRFGDLSHRVARWTCRPNGRAANALSQRAAADNLWRQLNTTTRDVFSVRVGQIINGSKLLQALAPRWKARLLNEIADHYSHALDKEYITLSFARPFDPDHPDAAKLLEQYETALRNRQLRMSVNYDKKELRVGCPSGRA